MNPLAIAAIVFFFSWIFIDEIRWAKKKAKRERMEKEQQEIDPYSYDQKWMNRNAPLNEGELGN